VITIGAEPLGEATGCYGGRFGERSEPNEKPQAARGVTYPLESYGQLTVEWSTRSSPLANVK